MLPPDIIREIGKHLDAQTYLHLLQTSKRYYNSIDHGKLRVPLITATYFKVKRRYKPEINATNLVTYLWHKIDTCRVGFADYWIAIELCEKLGRHLQMLQMEGCRDPQGKEKFAEMSSLILNIRLALHIRGISIPEKPCYNETPKTLRSKWREISLDDYINSLEIQERIEQLMKEYQRDKINLEEIKNDYHILFYR